MNVAVIPMRAIALFVPRFDEAVSQTAVQLRADLSEALAPDRTSDGERRDTFVERLVQATSEAATRGVYATPEALDRAVALVSALASDLPVPDVTVDDDGEIGLDWDEGRRRVLTVSVGEGPTLTFASLIGTEPLHGRAPFNGTVPETLAFLLRRLYATGSADRHR